MVDKRRDRLQVRMDADEMAVIREAAERAHMTVSEYARVMLLAAASATTHYSPEDAREMVRKTALSFGTADVWKKMDDRP